MSINTWTQSGLYVGNRLTYEHLNLTSYSKMRVNLAAQVSNFGCMQLFCRDHIWKGNYHLLWELVQENTDTWLSTGTSGGTTETLEEV